MPANSSRGPLTERVFAVLNRDPLDAPNQARTDLLVAGVVGVLGAALAVGVPGAGRLSTPSAGRCSPRSPRA